VLGAPHQHVADDPHVAADRADPLLLRDELLEHVVLQRAAQLLGADALLLGDATYSASSTAAGALMVIDVDTLSSGMSPNSRVMSSSDATLTPSRPTSPSERGCSGS
jgi:hypothetical protein